MSNLRQAAQQALDALEYHVEQTRPIHTTSAAIDALRAALAAPEPEPDMRHPKIQALIGSRARKNIEMMLVEKLLEKGPDTELTAMDMEYWNSTHDKLREALLRTAEPEPDEPERRCGGPGCDGNCCQPVAAAVAEPVAYSVGRTLHWHPGRGVNDAQLYAAPPQREPLNTGESGFMFQVGEEYETQAGELVRVIGRTTECLQCSDGMYRYDRKGNPGDAGRVTGTEHDYSFRGNFKRAHGISAPASAPKEQA